MYIPSFNRIDNPAILIEAMRTWSFATLFGPGPDGTPTATHLPLTIREEGAQITIEGHFARANPHWKSLANQPTLVVFSGPHAYISPANYKDPQSVPTWNYIAVHATGTLQLIEDNPGKLALLETLIQSTEPAYLQQWNTLPETYRKPMLHNIVGFRIPIDKLEGKFKLSQNRPDPDRIAVQATQSTGSPDEQALAAWMARLESAPESK